VGRCLQDSRARTYEDSTYAYYDGESFTVHEHVGDRTIGDEEYRGVLGPHRDKSFFDWWDAHYRGWLRYEV
jgi:hypothetical protein